MSTRNEIDTTQSTWLRKAKSDAMLRDPVDMLNDAEALVTFSKKRLDAMLEGSKPCGPKA